jgi:hypothetical protein
MKETCSLDAGIMAAEEIGIPKSNTRFAIRYHQLV